MLYRQNTNIEKIHICERAERASLENFLGIFYILKTAISFQYFVGTFRYFVGTNYMLVGLHVATNFEMYRQNSEKAL